MMYGVEGPKSRADAIRMNVPLSENIGVGGCK